MRPLLDTSEREVKRFGGLTGMAAAKALFGAGSRYAAKLLRCSGVKQWLHDRSTLLAISIDDMLNALWLSEEERLSRYRSQPTLSRAATSSEYRQRKNLRRSLPGLCVNS
jgi:thiopeptide-type bacteriocin biosynthesis protein